VTAITSVTCVSGLGFCRTTLQQSAYYLAVPTFSPTDRASFCKEGYTRSVQHCYLSPVWMRCILISVPVFLFVCLSVRLRI